MSWQLQEAKQKFSEMVRLALEEGPQTVTRHGTEVAVMVGAEEYRMLKGEGASGMDFKEFLTSGPDLEQLDIRRDRSLPREIELDARPTDAP